MLLFEKSAYDLSFKRLYLVLQVHIAIFVLLTLISEPCLELNGAIPQLIEVVLILPTLSANFVLQVT